MVHAAARPKDGSREEICEQRVEKPWQAYRPGTGSGGRSDVRAFGVGRGEAAARFWRPAAASTELRYDANVQAEDELAA